MKTISSRQHAFVGLCRAIAAGRADDPAAILLDGVHLVRDALAAHVPLDMVAVSQAACATAEMAALIDGLTAAGIEVVLASSSVIDAASPVRSPTGIVAVGRLRPRPLADVLDTARCLVAAAVGIQDPGNMGAIIRTADAAGVSGVVATSGCASPFGWKALRGAMGSAFRVPVVTDVAIHDLLAAARQLGVRTMALASTAAESVYACDLTTPTVVLVGAEGAGLDANTIAAADLQAHIPMAAGVESLNAAVAAAVVLFEARRQRDAAAVRRPS